MANEPHCSQNLPEWYPPKIKSGELVIIEVSKHSDHKAENVLYCLIILYMLIKSVN